MNQQIHDLELKLDGARHGLDSAKRAMGAQEHMHGHVHIAGRNLDSEKNKRVTAPARKLPSLSIFTPTNKFAGEIDQPTHTKSVHAPGTAVSRCSHFFKFALREMRLTRRNQRSQAVTMAAPTLMTMWMYDSFALHLIRVSLLYTGADRYAVAGF